MDWDFAIYELGSFKLFKNCREIVHEMARRKTQEMKKKQELEEAPSEKEDA